MEDEGLATTLVALVRQQAEHVAPPRALWVPFALGRPFGTPGDAVFQTRVLRAALDLLDRPSGPVLEDFPDDAPPDPVSGDGEEEGWVCPVRFPKRAAQSEGELLDAVLAEIDELAPWYQVSLNRRGRTTMGGSGLQPAEAARLMAQFVTGDTRASPLEGVTPADALRLASEDLKAYYFEAATAQPGAGASEGVIAWFWTETRGGDLVQALRAAYLSETDQALYDVGDFMLVPEIYRA